VVGVVEPVAQAGLGAESRWAVYLPHAQRPNPWMSVVLWTYGAPEAVVPMLRQAVAELDGELPVAQVETLARRRADSLARERFQTTLFAAFALLAVALAAVGVYGVTAYGVARRRRELAVRSALGASRGALFRLVVGATLAEAAAGLAAGLLAALALGRLMAGVLFGVRPADPFTFATVALLLTAVAFAAAYLPARWASAAQPATALRGQ
jgi:ABC-type antimicrobial peptide transport system permease subunit